MTLDLTTPDAGTVDWAAAINQNFEDIETEVNALAGDPVFVEAISGSNVASIDFDVQDGYVHVLVFTRLYATSSANDLLLRVSQNGGSSYFTGSNDYAFRNDAYGVNSGGGYGAVSASYQHNAILLWDNASMGAPPRTADDGAVGRILFGQYSTTTEWWCIFDYASGTTLSTSQIRMNGFGRFQDATSDVDNVQIKADSGNIYFDGRLYRYGG